MAALPHLSAADIAAVLPDTKSDIEKLEERIEAGKIAKATMDHQMNSVLKSLENEMTELRKDLDKTGVSEAKRRILTSVWNQKKTTSEDLGKALQAALASYDTHLAFLERELHNVRFGLPPDL